ncbi:hypothetical protein [Streptomyces sp. NPDC059452]|uniref:hypothetical protein n=1 Tax=Streptomyces sp. NPDC059452 TaxID=3346835 RepID=UPI00367A5AB9
MIEPVESPLLFLDVDGTLLPYGGVRLPAAPDEWAGWQHLSNPQLAKIDRTHGPRLLALPCTLIWAALLHRVASSTGLGEADFGVLEEWLLGVRAR